MDTHTIRPLYAQERALNSKLALAAAPATSGDPLWELTGLVWELPDLVASTRTAQGLWGPGPGSTAPIVDVQPWQVTPGFRTSRVSLARFDVGKISLNEIS